MCLMNSGVALEVDEIDLPLEFKLFSPCRQGKHDACAVENGVGKCICECHDLEEVCGESYEEEA